MELPKLAPTARETRDHARSGCLDLFSELALADWILELGCYALCCCRQVGRWREEERVGAEGRVGGSAERVERDLLVGVDVLNQRLCDERR